MEIISLLDNIGAAIVVYLVGTISPGPTKLAIMTTAMHSGRRNALWLASGVVTGSMFWGLVAASGLSFLITTYSGIAAGIMMLGGLYFMYLAYRGLRSFWLAVTGETTSRKALSRPTTNLYFQGLAIHLTNPKSTLGWAATIAVVIVPGSAPLLPFVVMVVCWLSGVVIFCGYAVFFSSRTMVAWYEKRGRWFDLGSGILFGIFALQLIGRGYATINYAQ